MTSDSLNISLRKHEFFSWIAKMPNVPNAFQTVHQSVSLACLMQSTKNNLVSLRNVIVTIAKMPSLETSTCEFII